MSFKKKIDMILEARKLERLTKNKIEKLIGVDGTIYKAYDDDREPADLEIVRNLIDRLGIRQQWWDRDWESGSKDIFNTSVQNGGDNPEIPLGVNLDEESKRLLAIANKTTQYAFVPKTILEGEYRIELKSTIDEKTELRRDAIQGYKKLVKKLEQEIDDLRSGRIPIMATAPQNTK